jgi:hypothetical protein
MLIGFLAALFSRAVASRVRRPDHLGQMVVAPAARPWVPDLAQDGRLVSYTGAMSYVSGLIVPEGSSATGLLLDAGVPPPVSRFVLAAVPAVAVGVLPRG